MKKITITVDVDGSAVSREYEFNPDTIAADYGLNVLSMIETIENSKTIPF